VHLCTMRWLVTTGGAVRVCFARGTAEPRLLTSVLPPLRRTHALQNLGYKNVTVLRHASAKVHSTRLYREQSQDHSAKPASEGARCRVKLCATGASATDAARGTPPAVHKAKSSANGPTRYQQSSTRCAPRRDTYRGSRYEKPLSFRKSQTKARWLVGRLT